MLEYKYYKCSTNFLVGGYLLEKDEYFQEIQLRLWSGSTGDWWRSEITFSFIFPPRLTCGEGFDWDQHSNKPNNNPCPSPCYSHVHQ